DYSHAPGSSSAKFKIPVHTLIVDDEIESRRAGNGVESLPSESDIRGTRDNMLGNRVLDGDEYPEINVQVNGMVNVNALNQYDVQLDFKGQQIMLNLEGQTYLAGDNIIIDAYFVLDHAQLNLRPFSVLGGMMKVAEQLRFELHVEAFPE
ncbi:MAG: hypothetical protein HKN08_12230, partial [Gammaproteobacteria bacterium]|nr:hypothetical protein [Gammaproteobacteria bacterium]